MIQALRSRDYSLYFTSTMLYSAARWMELTIIGWLVLELTNSPFLVTAVAAARSSAWLLGPWGGVLADRISKQRFLLIAQSLNVLESGFMLALLLGGQPQMWQIFLLTGLTAITSAMDFPARNSIIPELVAPGIVVNAVALGRVAQDVTTMLGPIAGGSFMHFFGVKTAYAMVVATYLANVVVILLLSPGKHSVGERKSAWTDMMAGLRHIGANRSALLILALAAIANFFGFSYTNALMPVFARDVYGVGPAGLGWLLGAWGAGSVAGSFSMALRARTAYQGWAMMASFLLWPAMMALFSQTPLFALALPVLFLAGAAQSVSMTTSTSLLLSCVPPTFRGRVMGARGLAITAFPLGNLLLGAGAALAGAPQAVLFSAILFSIAVLAVGVAGPGLRRL